MIENLLEKKRLLEQAITDGERVSELRLMIVYEALYKYYLNEENESLAEEYNKKFEEYKRKIEEIQKNLGYF